MDNHFFIAIPLPKELKQHLKEQLRKTWDKNSFQKWVHEEDYHITLVFLGAVSTDQRNNIVNRIHEQSVHWTPLTLKLDKTGTFGSKEIPRIYWIGLQENDDLRTLQRDIQDIVASCGVQVDKRPYSPHITVARKWNMKAAFQAKHVTFIDKPITISHVDLFQSFPKLEPKYKPIHTFHLGRVDI
ncbi:RNA 2',3'-cyclic phosphodiesterase [Alkalihalobacillus sp. FSL R5-0424]